MAAQFDYDVFLSYGPRDRIAATDLQEALEERGLVVWRDDRLTDTPGPMATAAIKSALERSARVLVLWSRHAQGSAWVKPEAEWARKNQCIVSLALEPVAGLTPFVPLPLQAVPMLDITLETFGIDMLMRALGAPLAAQGAVGAAGTPPGLAPRIPLMPANSIDISRLPVTFASRLYGRDGELAALMAAFDGGTTSIVALDGIAGTGKTALARHFITALETSGWRGARRVFAWSFAHQGTGENRRANADDFFKAATHFFSNYTAEPPRDPRERAVVLARLVQERRSLLVLDGLEPLQHSVGGPGTTQGGLRDPGLLTLLKALAASNPGLCLVTSRRPLVDLQGQAGFAAVPVGRLPLMAAIDLVRDLGVEPDRTAKLYKMPSTDAFATLVPPWQPPVGFSVAPGDDRAPMPPGVARLLIETVEDLAGHALSVTLAARFLAEHHQGDVRAVKEIPSLAQLRASDPDPEGSAPHRVLRAIEIALARRIEEQGQTEKPTCVIAGRELALLLFMGFFDRPIETPLLAAVFPKSGTPKPDSADLAMAATALDRVPDESTLPEREQYRRATVREARRRVLFRRLFAGMAGVSKGELRQALADLAARGLVTRVDPDVDWDQAVIDCHPLVRSHFGARLRELDVVSYEAGHGRIYDHYRFKGLPEAFRSPLMYALLADECAYPEYGARRTVEDLLSGEMTDTSRTNTSKVLLEATSAKLRAALALIDGPDWDMAIDAFLPVQEAGMSPVFAAIGHGCAAGRHQETLLETYRPRLLRGSRSFTAHVLGLPGQQLSASACFFDRPFEQPVATLAPVWQAFVSNEAGFLLRETGQLSDALVPMRLGTAARAKLGDFENAATAATNLSDLLLALGRIDGADGALATAAQAVTFAEKAKADHLLVAAACAQATACLASGALGQSEALFRRAEAIHAELLSSQRGYHYGRLLLARGRTAEASTRSSEALALAKKRNWHLDIGLAHLAKAQAAPSVEATTLALATLRKTGTPPLLASALLAHAHVLWQADASPHGHLQEADAVCTRGPMPLLAVASALLKARITLARQLIARSLKYRREAADLIAAHGYGGALPELAVLDAEIAAADGAADATAKLDAAIAAVSGTPYRDERTGRTIDGGWWGLMPRLEALLPQGHAARTRLESARNAYDAQRDAYLANAPTDDEGMQPQAVGEAHLGGDVDDITDADLDDVLADPEMCEALQGVLAEIDITTPIRDLPREEQRAVVAEFLAATRDLAKGKAAPVEQPVPVPTDAFVEAVFADPSQQALLEGVMADNDLQGAPAGLPFETKREIVQLLIELGDIAYPLQVQGDPDPIPQHARVHPDVPTAVAHSGAADKTGLSAEPRLGPSTSPRKSGWSWWPFAKKAG